MSLVWVIGVPINKAETDMSLEVVFGGVRRMCFPTMFGESVLFASSVTHRMSVRGTKPVFEVTSLISPDQGHHSTRGTCYTQKGHRLKLSQSGCGRGRHHLRLSKDTATGVYLPEPGTL